MTINGMLQIACYFLLLTLLVKPLGWYIARVYQKKSAHPFENIIYRIFRIDAKSGMDWKKYLISMLIFNFFSFVAVYFLQRLQNYLPLNPQAFPAIDPELAFNTASSFSTNTDWQAYSGETTMSYFTQMFAFTVQNFISAASGMSLLVAIVRGFSSDQDSNLGNFWMDTVRGVLYILLPLSLVFAIFLTSQGVIQNYKPYQITQLVEPFTYQQPDDGKTITQFAQIMPMGPAASQVAIKQLGSNGGGFFNANSAHPFENPTALSNFFELLAILLLPAALCYTFGLMVKDTRQGWAVFFAMMLMLIPFVFFGIAVEQQGNPALTQFGVAGANMEGKETRFGIVNSVLWTSAATAISNGSVNSMLDSYTPLGGIVPLWLMHLGEVVFGGVGSGLYGMLLLIIITVFVAGLMVGRTPEYLGKKIEPYEMKMAVFAVLLMPLIVLLLTAVAVIIPAGVNAVGNSGVHGFSEILYAFTSMGNNNGSAFMGLNANSSLYNLTGGFEMLILRDWIAIPALAIAGSLAKKKIIPGTLGTLPTHTLNFVILLIAVTMVLGALTFFPALALGPIVEHFMLWGQYGR